MRLAFVAIEHVLPTFSQIDRIGQDVLGMFALLMLFGQKGSPAHGQFGRKVQLVRVKVDQTVQLIQCVRLRIQCGRVDKECLRNGHSIQKAGHLVQNALVHNRMHNGRDQEHFSALRQCANVIDAVTVGHGDKLVLVNVWRRNFEQLATLDRIDETYHARVAQNRNELQVDIIVERCYTYGHHGNNAMCEQSVWQRGEHKFGQVKPRT